MAEPSALVLHCDACGEVPHRVLSGRVTGRGAFVFQGTVKCTRCGRVRSEVVREPRPVEVRVIVSDAGSSGRGIVEMAPDETVRVGDRLEVEGLPVLVTAIEHGGRRVRRARARDAPILWAKRFDRVRVKVSVVRGSRTSIVHVDAAPDEEFLVGDVVDVGRDRVLVHRIRTQTTTLRQGGAEAADILQVFGRVVREREGR